MAIFTTSAGYMHILEAQMQQVHIASAYGLKLATGKAAITKNEALLTKLTTGNAFMYAVCFFFAFIVRA